jgi:hypothetical protein
MTTTKYFVILGDIIESSNHPEVPELLHKTVDAVNALKTDTWVAPFEITRGDEIACIVRPACNWFALIRMFIEKMMPYKLRWVVVYDELTGGLSYRSSAEAVGPAFIKADTRMRELKGTSYYFDLESGHESADMHLRGGINLLLWRLYSLSPLQHAMLRSYQRLHKQQDVAEALGKTQQQVQKSLKDMQWEIIDYAERAIDRYFKEVVASLQ